MKLFSSSNWCSVAAYICVGLSLLNSGKCFLHDLVEYLIYTIDFGFFFIDDYNLILGFSLVSGNSYYVFLIFFIFFAGIFSISNTLSSI